MEVFWPRIFRLKEWIPIGGRRLGGRGLEEKLDGVKVAHGC